MLKLHLSIIVLVLTAVAHGKRRTCGPADNLPKSFLEVDTRELVVGKECEAIDPINILPQKSDCINKFEAQGELGCCCAKSDRSLDFHFDKADFDASDNCPISKVVIKVSDKEECPLRVECCESCKCFGDPHCESFAQNQATRNVKVRDTFSLCDVRRIPKTSDPELFCGTQSGSRVLKKSKFKQRCMGTASGYSFNKGKCRWIGNEPGYSFSTHGAPCQPLEEDVDRMMTLADGPENKVLLYTGERGVINSVSIVDKRHDVQVSLNSRVNCNSWCPSGVDNLADCENSFASRTFTYGAFTFSREDVKQFLDGSERVVDVWWNVESVENNINIVVKCFGNTTPEIMGGPHFASTGGLAEGAYRIEETGSVTFRTPVTTRLGVAVYDKAIGEDSIYDNGFCTKGSFQEKEVLFASVGGDPFKQCTANNKLDEDDFKLLMQEPTCQQLLNDNSCGSFTIADSEKYRTDRREMIKIMDLCVEKLCETFKYVASTENQFVAPPGTDPIQCKTDVYDFGVEFVVDLYTNTFRSSSTTLCTPKLEIVLDGVVHEPNEDGEVVLYPGLGDPVPELVQVKQSHCPNQCSANKNFKTEVKYVSECEDLLSIINSGNAQLTYNGEQVNLERFTNLRLDRRR